DESDADRRTPGRVPQPSGPVGLHLGADVRRAVGRLVRPRLGDLRRGALRRRPHQRRRLPARRRGGDHPQRRRGAHRDGRLGRGPGQDPGLRPDSAPGEDFSVVPPRRARGHARDLRFGGGHRLHRCRLLRRRGAALPDRRCPRRPGLVRRDDHQARRAGHRRHRPRRGRDLRARHPRGDQRRGRRRLAGLPRRRVRHRRLGPGGRHRRSRARRQRPRHRPDPALHRRGRDLAGHRGADLLDRRRRHVLVDGRGGARQPHGAPAARAARPDLRVLLRVLVQVVPAHRGRPRPGDRRAVRAARAGLALRLHPRAAGPRIRDRRPHRRRRQLRALHREARRPRGAARGARPLDPRLHLGPAGGV
ncbi:MAG: Choline permease LicB, partial [uncultured Actinomycetospora sp.]